MKKEKACLVFFNPDDSNLWGIGLKGISKLSNFVKNMERHKGVNVKLVPISHKHPSRVMAKMNMIEGFLAEQGCSKTISFGLGESGKICVVDDKAYRNKFFNQTSEPETIQIQNGINKLVKEYEKDYELVGMSQIGINPSDWKLIKNTPKPSKLKTFNIPVEKIYTDNSKSNDMKKEKVSEKENNPKEKKAKSAFIIFTDLDGTFLPIGNKGIKSLAKLIKDIKSKENADVKIVPVSGRPANYVLGVMESLKEILKTEKIDNVIDFGGAEIGGIFVELKDKKTKEIVLEPKNATFGKTVIDTIKNSPYKKYFGLEEYEAIVANFIVLKEEYCTSITKDEREKIVDGVYDLLRGNLDKEATVLRYEKYLETSAPKIGKENAIDFIFRKYQEDYNIKGFCYAGDSQNDLMAMKHLAKLSEVPGIEAFSIAPSNAAKVLNSDKIEGWKKDYHNKSFNINTNKQRPRFLGVIDELRLKLDKGTLVGTGIESRKPRDMWKKNINTVINLRKLQRANTCSSAGFDKGFNI